MIVRGLGLYVDGRSKPQEVDTPRPRLSWRFDKVESPVQLGMALIELFQVDARVSAHIPLWATRVNAAELAVSVPNDVLKPLTTYRWTVTVEGHDLEYFEPVGSTFRTGMRGVEWPALWIAGDRRAETVRGIDAAPMSDGIDIPRSWATMYASSPTQFRKTLDVPRSLSAARLYITAKGVYRAFVNGKRVGEDILTPEWTDYDQHLEYQCYDITAMLDAGANVLGVTVADGWWAGFVGYDTRSQARQYGDDVELLVALQLEYTDGTTQWVGSDSSWTAASGAIVMSDLLMGEYHDLTVATPGWSTTAFTEVWPSAIITGDDVSNLSGRSVEPIRATATLAPISIMQQDDRVVLDFGRNIVGYVNLEVPGIASGTIVQLLHGEMLHNGHVYQDNLRTAEQRDVIVSAGRPYTFEPWFTLHGFRYVEITGLPRSFSAEGVFAVVVTSELQIAGSFSTGSEQINQLQDNIVSSQRANYIGIPTDCPQRDERLGWTADTQIFAHTAMFNSNIQSFLGRWMGMLSRAQRSSGCVPDVVPTPPRAVNFDTGAPGWGDAAVIVPWALYQEYGDRDLLREHYPTMKAWVTWVASQNSWGRWTKSLGNNYGDWLSVDEETPRSLVAAAYQIRSNDLLVRAAETLGFDQDADTYRRYGSDLRTTFSNTFVGPDGRIYGDTQTGYLFALAWDLVSPAHRPATAERLVQKLEERGRRLTSGFLGVNLLCPVLSEIGRDDIALDLLFQRAYPSWGYSIEHGATTIWERWDGWTDTAGFQDKRMNSFNHYSLGSVGEWMYSRIGGIQQADGSVAYKRVRVAPVIDPRLSPVAAWHECVRGRVEVSWSLVGTSGQATVVVPPTMEAEVILPGIAAVVGAGRHHFDFDSSPLNSRGRSLTGPSKQDLIAEGAP